MRLRIVTPLARVVEAEGVTAFRAADASGSFGILPGHADYLTSLALCVASWRAGGGPRQYCALRGGVLTVSDRGGAIDIATREAVPGDDMATLAETVLARFRDDLDRERIEHVETARLELSAIRQLVARLRPRPGTGGPA